MSEKKKLLQVKNLCTHFLVEGKEAHAVDDVSFDIYEDEMLGIVGESGSGKSVTSLSIMRLIPDPPGKIAGGEILFDGKDLLKLSYDDMRKVRGKDIAMIFQEPMTSLNPVFTIGMQVMESLQFHENLSKEAATVRAVEVLTQVGIPDAERRLGDYPHQFSGGMRQRVMIAMALICTPALLIADEPTTALDVTIQAQILDLMKNLQAERKGAAILLITHDLAVVAETCDRVIVMYGGQVQEIAPITELFDNPRHPYTKGLLNSIPHMQGRSMSPEASPLLEVEDLKVWFPVYGGVLRHQVGTVKAVDGLTFTLQRGEVLGLVGESGSGKTTVGRAVINLHKPMYPDVELAGKIAFRARADSAPVDLNGMPRKEMTPHRSDVQMIFQDPFSSLNPRMTVQQIIEGPMKIHTDLDKEARKARVLELLERVGLQPQYSERYPHEFSGGQRQRIGIARALATRPSLIIADEPVSALDVSVQAQVINLMLELKEEFGLTYIFVAHDLSVVYHISDRIAVMYLGNIVEIGTADQVYKAPKHPYSKALLSSVPKPDPRSDKSGRVILEGDIPTPLAKPSGCGFRTRCPIAKPECASLTLALEDKGSGQMVACPYVD
ncbi:UNVERIFIED_CONTAM: hypothetical protein GTU68_003134 [Idotea baltica]|nr:hypothetical protein [Idotea baltica]